MSGCGSILWNFRFVLHRIHAQNVRTSVLLNKIIIFYNLYFSASTRTNKNNKITEPSKLPNYYYYYYYHYSITISCFYRERVTTTGVSQSMQTSENILLPCFPANIVTTSCSLLFFSKSITKLFGSIPKASVMLSIHYSKQKMRRISDKNVVL